MSRGVSARKGTGAGQVTDVMWKATSSGFSCPVRILYIRKIITADFSSDVDNFGALLTADWRPKVAAAVLA